MIFPGRTVDHGRGGVAPPGSAGRVPHGAQRLRRRAARAESASAGPAAVPVESPLGESKRKQDSRLARLAARGLQAAVRTRRCRNLSPASTAASPSSAIPATAKCKTALGRPCLLPARTSDFTPNLPLRAFAESLTAFTYSGRTFVPQFRVRGSAAPAQPGRACESTFPPVTITPTLMPLNRLRCRRTAASATAELGSISRP